MVRAASGSQSSQLVARGGAAGSGAVTKTGPPSGVGPRGRRPGGGRTANNRSNAGMNFYTDDSPGLKITPMFVIGMSVSFVLFVSLLHIIGKVRGV